MPKFSKRSTKELDTVHIVLQRLLKRVIERTDFTVLCGHRGQAAQDAAAAEGKSKLKFPFSRHNTSPSMAVDVAPWPIDWNDMQRFRELAEIMKEEWAAMPEDQKLRYELVWGGDWKTFVDAPHFELRFAEGLNPPTLRRV
jgi:peptidoglycan L-alanyl-D-glutamate endopeptidase CwlK